MARCPAVGVRRLPRRTATLLSSGYAMQGYQGEQLAAIRGGAAVASALSRRLHREVLTTGPVVYLAACLVWPERETLQCHFAGFNVNSVLPGYA